MNDVFQFVEKPYSLRSNEHFKIERFRTTRYGSEHSSEAPSYLGPKLWQLVPTELKSITSLAEFKKKIKNWFPENCPSRLCKVYIHHVGFI